MSHFRHLASLVWVWAKLILGRFRDAVLPDFSQFPAGSEDYLNSFFTDLLELENTVFPKRRIAQFLHDPRHGCFCVVTPPPPPQLVLL